VPFGTLLLLAIHVGLRIFVRAKCARGEFAKQICASIVFNRGLVLNPTASANAGTPFGVPFAFC